MTNELLGKLWETRFVEQIGLEQNPHYKRLMTKINVYLNIRDSISKRNICTP